MPDGPIEDALGWLEDQATERGDRGEHARTLLAYITDLRSMLRLG